MTTRAASPSRHSWTVRAGALVAAATAVAASTLVGASPALAAGNIDLRVVRIDSTQVTSGKSIHLRYEISNDGPDAVSTKVQVQVGPGLGCDGDCGSEGQIPARTTMPFDADIKADNLPPGEQQRSFVTVSAQAADQAPQVRTKGVTVVGPQKPQSVGRISGMVTDAASGKSIGNAVVRLQDSTGQILETRADGNGGFAFNGSDSQPIAPGKIIVGASAGNGKYTAQTTQFRLGAGQSRNGIILGLTLANASPSPSASASASTSASASATPSAESTEPSDGTDSGAAPAGTTDTTAASNDSTSGSTWLLIGLGALLLAAGVGALVLLWLRRRQDRDDDQPIGGPAGPQVPRPYSPASNPALHAPTMAVGSLANAATVVQPAIRDEYADPYGMPPLAPGMHSPGNPSAQATQQYAAPPAGYGTPPTQQYGQPQYGTPPTQQYSHEPTQQYGAQDPAQQYGAQVPAQQYGASQAWTGAGQTTQLGGFEPVNDAAPAPSVAGYPLDTPTMGAGGPQYSEPTSRIDGNYPLTPESYLGGMTPQQGGQPPAQPSAREQYERRMMEWMDD